MALKIGFSDMSITSVRASVGKVKATLKVWGATDNTAVDPPVLEEEIWDSNAKIYVEGVDYTTLAERVKKVLQPEAQAKVNYYQTETEKIDNVTSAMSSMVAEVETELTSKEVVK